MKKIYKSLLLLALVLVLAFAAFACKDDTDPADKPGDDTPTVENATVTFVNGDTTVATKTVKKGDKLTAEDIPAAPTAVGATFDGWYVGETKVEAGYTVNADVTVTAKFDKITYTLTFKAEGKDDVVVTVAHGEVPAAKDLPAEPSKGDTYRFDGWYDAENEVFEADAAVTANATYTAKFILVAYKVTYTAEGAEDVSFIVPITETTKLPADKIAQDATAPDDAFFAGYYNGSVKAVADLVLTEDTVFAARFLTKDSFAGAWVNAEQNISMTIGATGATGTIAGSFKFDAATGKLKIGSVETWTLTLSDDLLSVAVDHYYDQYGDGYAEDFIHEYYTLTKHNLTGLEGKYVLRDNDQLVINEVGIITKVGDNGVPFGFISMNADGTYTVAYQQKYSSLTKKVATLDEKGNLVIDGAIWVKCDSAAFAEGKKLDGKWEYLHIYTVGETTVYTYKTADGAFAYATVDGTFADGEIITVTAGDYVVTVKLKQGSSRFTLVFAAAEKGEYNGADGKYILDGFGTATDKDGTTAAYTLNAAGVAIIGDKGLKLDTENKTYTVLAKDAYAAKFDYAKDYAFANKQLTLDGFGGASFTENGTEYKGTYTVDAEAGTITIAKCTSTVNGTFTFTHDGKAFQSADRSREFVNTTYRPTVDATGAAFHGYYEDSKGNSIKIYYEHNYLWLDLDGTSYRPTLNWDGTALLLEMADTCSDFNNKRATFIILVSNTGITMTHNCTVKGEDGYADTQKKTVAYTTAEEPAFAFPASAQGTWYLNDNTVVVITETTITVGGVTGTDYATSESFGGTNYCFNIGGVAYIVYEDSSVAGTWYYCAADSYDAITLSKTEHVTEPDGLEGTYKYNSFTITLDGKGNGTYNNGTEYTFTYTKSGDKYTVSNFASYDDGENSFTVTETGISVHFSGSYGDDVFNQTFTKQVAETTDGLEGTYKYNSFTITLDGKGNGTYNNGTEYTFTYTKSGDKYTVSNFASYDDGENSFTVTETGISVHFSGSYGDDVFNQTFTKETAPAETTVPEAFRGTWSGDVTAFGSTMHYEWTITETGATLIVDNDTANPYTYTFVSYTDGKLILNNASNGDVTITPKGETAIHIYENSYSEYDVSKATSKPEETKDAFEGTWKNGNDTIIFDGKGNGSRTQSVGGTTVTFTYKVGADGKATYTANYYDWTVTLSGDGKSITLSYYDDDAMRDISLTFTKEEASEPVETHDAFYGTWSGKIGVASWTIEFKDDGTFVANGTTYHYEVDASNANKAKSTDDVFKFEIKSSGLYVERYDDDMCETYTGTLTKA